jgi:protease I
VAHDLDGVHVAFLVANEGVEQIELVGPWEALRAAGAVLHLVAPEKGKVQAMHHLDPGDVFEADRSTAEAEVADYAAVVLPGGVANPDQLRTDQPAVAFLRRFAETGRPIAAICHAPWTLIDAGVVRGRTLTSWPSLSTDITNAGGQWVDEEVVVDGNLITSRKPDDLPAFCAALLDGIRATRG